MNTLIPVETPAGDISWPSLDTSSSSFTWELPPPPVAEYWHLVAEARTVGKRPLSILLECFLVIFNTYISVPKLIRGNLEYPYSKL